VIRSNKSPANGRQTFVMQDLTRYHVHGTRQLALSRQPENREPDSKDPAEKIELRRGIEWRNG